MSYSTHVTVPKRFWKQGTQPQNDCSMRLGLARCAAAVKPIDKQSDIEICDLTLTFTEQHAHLQGVPYVVL